MIYPLDRIMRDVRVCLDENRIDEALLDAGDSETLTLDEIIRSKVLQGVDYVHSLAPYRLLEQGHNFDGFSDAVYWQDQASGFVLLPDDFLRLVVFEMSDWERPVFVPISTDDVQYKHQRSRWKGLRGTVQRPVCAVVQRPEGLSLEFYSCRDEEATITRAVYIPKAAVDENNGVDVSEKCYEAVTYAVAWLVLTTTGEAERAEVMNAKALNLLGIEKQ